MFQRFSKPAAALSAVFTLTACASDGSFPGSDLTTASLQQKVESKPKVDPTCVALSAKINELRADGITGRVEKAGAGKTKTVSVYRTSLSRMAELDRTNAEFQSKCSPIPPASAQQAAVRSAPTDAQTAKKTAATAKTAPAPVKTVAQTSQAKTPPAKPSTSTAKATSPSSATTGTASTAVPLSDTTKTAATDAAKKTTEETAKQTVAKKVAKEETTPFPTMPIIGQP